MPRKPTENQRKMNTITPGKFQVGQTVRPIHPGEFSIYGHGTILDIAIRKNGYPYQIKFQGKHSPAYYPEEDIE